MRRAGPSGRRTVAARRRPARAASSALDACHRFGARATQRASRWHEHAGLIDEAIEHANAAGDGARSARLMFEHGDDLLNERRYVSVCRLIDAMPPERGEYGPYCRALYLLAMALDGASLQIVYEGLQELKAHYDA